jgi:transcriptional regulator with PAS, ATPase and Fis domain
LAGVRHGRTDGIELIGRSAVMAAFREEIDRVSRSHARVLITGESGSGKELVARNIHACGPRAASVFAPVNCAGLPETLLESELFGHVKGSFTGAYRDKPGKLETAHHGTVFLDEIGEMTLRMQGLLLRFLSTGEIQKVGAEGRVQQVDVRIIAATNRNLRDMLAEGTFREDLFYRLNVVHLAVPPLRQRRDDIPELAQVFLARFARANGSMITGITPMALRALSDYSWPGNVRELENVVERMVVTVQADVIDTHHLPPEISSGSHLNGRPRRERRRTIADELYRKMREERESFWTVVHPLYVDHEITRETLRDLVRRGLQEARGNYRIVADMFNTEPREYKRFLNFLRKNDCQIPFKDYR